MSKTCDTTETTRAKFDSGDDNGDFEIIPDNHVETNELLIEGIPVNCTVQESSVNDYLDIGKLISGSSSQTISPNP